MEPKATPMTSETSQEKPSEVSENKKGGKVFTREETDQELSTLTCCNEWVDPDQFFEGMNIEAEHWSQNPELNITNDDPKRTAKIVLAHLAEIPDYYTRLKKMEEDYESEKNGKKKEQPGVGGPAAEGQDAWDFMVQTI